MRPQNRSKSYNCTEHTVVNETGISRKECVSTRGDLTDETMETYTFRSRSKKVNREKSAEAIVEETRRAELLSASRLMYPMKLKVPENTKCQPCQEERNSKW